MNHANGRGTPPRPEPYECESIMSQATTCCRILAVDDDDQVLALLKAILELEGYQVDAVGDGIQAVQVFDPAVHALVITDIVMPEKEGIETIMELRAVRPDLPVIAISGGGRIGADDYLAWVRRCGVHHTFTKPVPRQDLLDAVAELVGVPAR